MLPNATDSSWRPRNATWCLVAIPPPSVFPVLMRRCFFSMCPVVAFSRCKHGLLSRFFRLPPYNLIVSQCFVVQMAKYFDGSPLTPALLTELMGIPSLTVTDIEVLQTHDQIPGTDKSGRHSNITRVAIKTATPGPITHLIIKRVACPELSDRSWACGEVRDGGREGGKERWGCVGGEREREAER